MRIHVFVLLLIGLVVPIVPARSEPATSHLTRADGTDIIYHLDRPEHAERQALLLLMQGSGCDPIAGDAQITSTAPMLAPRHAVLTIEKYGVVPGSLPVGAQDGCSSAYWAGNTLQQRVLDAIQVIAHLRSQRWWNGELVIFGGSEGGAVAALLAPLLPETRAVVIRSSGIGVSVRQLVLAAVPPPVAAEMPRIMDEAKANPTGNLRWGGASYRWWADAADLVPARALLQTNVPVLLIQGTRDQYAPVSTARATRDLFAEAGKHNLTYREYEDYDHFMVDSAGVDHRTEVLQDAALWLRTR